MSGEVHQSAPGRFKESGHVSDPWIGPTTVVILIMVILPVAKCCVGHACTTTAQRCRPQHWAHEEVQKQQSWQCHENHLHVGAQRHLHTTYLQRPWPVPELLPSQGVTQATTNGAKHQEQIR